MAKRPALPYPVVRLKQGRDSSVLRGHPWIFSGAVGSVEAAGRGDGVPVSILSSSGEPLGTGHHFNNSIEVKVVSRENETLDAKFWQKRIEQAARLRAAFGLGLDAARTDCYRLVNGEGDFCPGLIIDRYCSSAVVQLQTQGTIRAEAEITAGLSAAADVLGFVPEIVVRKKGVSQEEAEDCAESEPQSKLVTIRENGIAYQADLISGQKTGFFLDQRENRFKVREVSRGKKVLNLFCYSGAFSASAFAGGASSVVSVDSSKSAIALCEQNIELNGYTKQHTAISEDCFTYLEQEKEIYDIVICDPPAFVKHQKALKRGLTGYEAINALSLRAVRSGGLLFTYSCSQLVLRDDFMICVSKAASKVGRQIQIVGQLHAAPCHPFAIGHPEGEYLKGLVLRVD
jgi:23S rRNA (cytosine1962-C5)-methyltransferase